MNWKHVATAAIGTLIVLVFIAKYVNGFTSDTHRFIAQKTTQGMIIDEPNLFKGATDPDNNLLYSDNPEFSPENHYCFNASECNAIKWSETYRRKALEETDREKQSYYYGVAINFYSDSLIRSQRIENECYGEFENQIEQKIKSPTTSWSVIQQCPDDKGVEIITLRYTEKDLNQAISLTNKYINPSNQKPIDANKLKPTEQELLAIVKRLIDQNISTEEEIQLAVRLLVQSENFTCFQTSERKNQLYQEWKKLDTIGRACLEYFSSLPSTNPQFFIQQCPLLPKDVSGATLAQITLDQYYRSGFSDVRSFGIQQPTSIIDSSGKVTTTTQTINFIEYVPKKIKGCAIEFKEREKESIESRDQGLMFGIGTMFTIGIIGFLVITMLQRGG